MDTHRVELVVSDRGQQPPIGGEGHMTYATAMEIAYIKRERLQEIYLVIITKKNSQQLFQPVGV